MFFFYLQKCFFLPAKVCSWERSSTALPLLAWHVRLFSLLPCHRDHVYYDDDDGRDDYDDDGHDNGNDVSNEYLSQITTHNNAWRNRSSNKTGVDDDDYDDDDGEDYGNSDSDGNPPGGIQSSDRAGNTQRQECPASNLVSTMSTIQLCCYVSKGSLQN